MGLNVVAEGVETQEQMEIVQQMKCDVIQGFYYSKPMSPDMFIETYIR